jgi:hypothetical protein
MYTVVNPAVHRGAFSEEIADVAPAERSRTSIDQR